MANLILRTAIGTYGHTKALTNGAAKSRHFEIEHIEVSPVTSIFRRMVRGLEFDMAEMPLSTYLRGRAHGKAFTAILYS
jgi:4,5-dihydroxyphthalate decarboxylase